MAINKDFVFADKGDGKFGTLDYTWDFTSHWPILTLEYLENMTGINLADKKATTELAEIELKKVMRLSKLFLFKKLKRVTQFKLEYIVAKDNDRLNEALEYQVHIFEAVLQMVVGSVCMKQLMSMELNLVSVWQLKNSFRAHY